MTNFSDASGTDNYTYDPISNHARYILFHLQLPHDIMCLSKVTEIEGHRQTYMDTGTVIERTRDVD